jgi:hypothetical protein
MARFTKILRTKGMKKLSTDRKLHKAIARKSEEVFKRHKKQMLDDFSNHKVTKEIQGGAEESNISGTIVGPGNLFSFIGFNSHANPIGAVYNILNLGTYISKGAPKIVKKTKDRVYLGMKVSYPSVDALAAASPMPWEPGSWLFKIEKGISGLGYYIYQKQIRGSRSGSGIQSDHKVKQAMYKRTSYMSAILNTFKRRFSK